MPSSTCPAAPAACAAVTRQGRVRARIELGANYDGLGQSDFEAYGVRAKVTIPLGK